MKKGGTMIVDQSSLLDRTSAYWEGFLFCLKQDFKQSTQAKITCIQERGRVTNDEQQ